ncbi:MAG: HAD-IIIC family phosphatase [Endomicrobiia bacterium]
MLTFNDLKKNLKKDFKDFKNIKVAILGDTATQFLAQAIRGYGYELKLNLEIFEADFNQIDQQILDKNSDLYRFAPDFTIIFESSHILLQKYNKQDSTEHYHFADINISHIKSLVTNLQNNSKSKIIFLNFTEEDDKVFGNYANKTPSSFIFQLRKLNYLLMELASQTEGLFVCDISTIQNNVGKQNMFLPHIYINSEMAVDFEVLPILSQNIVQIIASIVGNLKKCLIVDLDNTLWGGIIGDDGIENIQIGKLGIGKAFTELQYWIKKLSKRGIIICVCSKNTEHIAKEPFEKHPDMVLKLEDIAVFIANWNNKADNIKKIKEILNIGYDSMVFLDDNPFERNIVRENIPEICVPELPQDPAYYLEYLYSLNLFETASYTTEDITRNELYRQESLRIQEIESYANEDEYLKNLQMKCTVKKFDNFTTPRIAQLSQRSNQFNLRTIRYTEDEIKKIASSQNYFTFSFSLEDKFGDNGLISVIILEKISENELFIDTWFMSCRVLKRGVEKFALNVLVKFAKENAYKYLIGEYIPTEKNILVKDHYASLGFQAKENYWVLDVDTYIEKECYIELL